MKYIIFIFALLTITTSCELRTTNFDPDNQLVSEDELAQIAVWDHYQSEQLSAEDDEIQNSLELIRSSMDYRQNSSGKWVIEGSIQNFASTAHFKNLQLTISYYGEENELIGSEKYTLNEELAPGDQTGFYFKSDKFKNAQSLKMEVGQLNTAQQ